MTGGEHDPADDLRRRLYAPGASAADVARYRTLAGPEPEPGTAAPSPDPRPDPPARRRRTALLAAGGLLTALAVGAAGIAVAGGRGPDPAATRTPPAVAVPVQTTLPIEVAARVGFVRALASGGDAGLLQFFLDNPDARPDAIRTISRAASDEYHGTGSGTIALEPSALAERGGRMTVLVVLDDAAKFEWRATRLAQSNDRSGPEVPVDRRSGLLQPGEVGTTTIAYRSGAPTSLLVLVGEGVRWGAVVVFTD
ncbi:hypothetical protein [uncultured Amnibacterium sp.]|uniref:hypothetical protein n=1 Tax=uncultured Amnibacterium sp. TaxID=1631851 RepID=UPI0035CC6EB0